MKRQTIYAMLIVAIAMTSLTQAHAQTAENGVSEARIRRLQSPDEIGKTTLRFSAVASGRTQMSLATAKQLISPSSPKELRAQIFENYEPSTLKRALRSSGPPLGLQISGADKLPSETPLEETTEAANRETFPVHNPPNQGDAKEMQ